MRFRTSHQPYGNDPVVHSGHRRCGECDITCPDYCFVWEKGKDPKTGKDGMVLLGIDYQFCKGCLRCTHICKFGALVPVKEAEQDMETITVKHKHLK
jgi:pyruvate ferredoxin oxidoreductase gamma subunit